MNMKKKALRVNTFAPLAAFAEKSPNKNPAQYVSGGALLMPKHPDAVPIKSINLWDLPEYVPPKHEPVRAGADNHLKYKSRGF